MNCHGNQYFELSFVSQFHLPKRPFWSGVLFFFGGDNAYQKSVEKIYGAQTIETLAEDIARLKSDYLRMLELHRTDLPCIEKFTDKLEELEERYQNSISHR